MRGCLWVVVAFSALCGVVSRGVYMLVVFSEGQGLSVKVVGRVGVYTSGHVGNIYMRVYISLPAAGKEKLSNVQQ